MRARTVLLDVRKAAANRLGALQRNSSGLINDILEEEINKLSEMKQQHEISANKAVAKLARRIPECQMLAQAAGVKNGWLLISTIVAYVGDPTRFRCLEALNKFCGMHVVDGKAPRRRKGVISAENTKVKSALWNIVNLAVLNVARGIDGLLQQEYQTFLQAELAVHAEKCPDCKNAEFHSMNRARRRVMKSILQRFYDAAVGGQAINVTQPKVFSAQKSLGGQSDRVDEQVGSASQELVSAD